MLHLRLPPQRPEQIPDDDAALLDLYDGRMHLHFAIVENDSASEVLALLARCPGAAAASPIVVAALPVAHPAGATEKDGMGWLPLHFAAAKQAPPGVVAALLDAHPGGAAEKDSKGDLPLHLAAANQAPSEVLAALLKVHPGGATEKGSKGDLPLHLAAVSKAPPEVLATLLAAHPSSATMKGKDSQLPMQRIASRPAEDRGTFAAEVARLRVAGVWHEVVKDSAASVLALLEQSPGAASIPEKMYGRLPLNVAAANTAPVEVLAAPASFQCSAS
ncbi:hypothetical protein FOA52_001087 [Chlamydomonas sp. UWO 241]|nr:hypothetical protein FOA52_001087 [Chlamydomonas sp. UWO 241]